jgi:hypothetical protein
VPQLASTGTTVLVLVIVLVGLGVAMVWLAVWLTRSTRTDVPALGPLEAMGTRGFRRGDEAGRTARLSDARPDGAPDPAPIVALEELPIADGDAGQAETELDQPENDAAEPVEQDVVAEPAEEAEEAENQEAEETVASPEPTVEEMPAAEEPAPPAEATPDAPPVVASVLLAPSPLELETDEDESVTTRPNGSRVEEPR